MDPNKFFSLEGQVALVTGASRGIGRAIALVFARAGAKVALAARDEELLKQVADEIEGSGGEALICPMEVTDPKAVNSTVGKILETFGRLDILVNNAGIAQVGPLEDVSLEDWQAVMDVNLMGPFLCCKAVVPVMKEQRYGRIINMSSVAAHTGGVAGASNYATSKGGLISFGKTLTRDLAPYGITVNAIAPGQIETDMGRVSDPARMEKVLKATPTGRMGTPEDIAFAALFLASREAGYVLGVTLDVDGGIAKR
jgi:3-oxoacyl-[acyl-carrier protein] reductase